MLLANTGCIICALLGDPMPRLLRLVGCVKITLQCQTICGAGQTWWVYGSCSAGGLCWLLAALWLTAQVCWKGFVCTQLGTSGSLTASVFLCKTWGQEILKCLRKHKYMDVYVTKASIFSAFKISVFLSLCYKCSHTRNEHLAESCMCLLFVALALFSLYSLYICFCLLHDHSLYFSYGFILVLLLSRFFFSPGHIYLLG